LDLQYDEALLHFTTHCNLRLTYDEALFTIAFKFNLRRYSKVASALLFFCFSHIFIVCESNHNNHYILFCYALALAPFTCMDSSLSLNAFLYHRKHPKSPPRKILRHNLVGRH
jgi:hypothetical protein